MDGFEHHGNTFHLVPGCNRKDISVEMEFAKFIIRHPRAWPYRGQNERNDREYDIDGYICSQYGTLHEDMYCFMLRNNRNAGSCCSEK